MKLLKNGRNTSKLEVTNISEHGFWLYFSGREYFLSFKEYPWFKNAKISAIIDVKVFHNHHFYWPQLDVDLTTEIISNPALYPLIYK